MSDSEKCSICLGDLASARDCGPSNSSSATVVQVKDSADVINNPLIAAANTSAAESSTAVAATTDTTTTTTATTTECCAPAPRNYTDDEYIAKLDSCDHAFHYLCIMPWTSRANSCPMCRVDFHKIHVMTPKPDETRIRTYRIEDKKQAVLSDFTDVIANMTEFEHPAWLHDEKPCPVCNTGDDEEVLLLCDGCDSAYHTYCIGLVDIPEGVWTCMECVDRRRRGLPYHRIYNGRPQAVRRTMRTRHGLRRASTIIRHMDPEPHQPWRQLVNHVRDHTDIDLDGDNDAMSDLWRGRTRAISRLIQDESEAEYAPSRAFRTQDGRPMVRHITYRQAPIEPIPEVPAVPGDDEVAWGALDRVLASNANADAPPTTTGRRGNQRVADRSATFVASSSSNVTSSQLRPPSRRKRPAADMEEATGSSANGEPSSSSAPVNTERKLKRPCTRKPPSAASASTTAATSASSPTGERPSFVSALLKEVGLRPPSDDGLVGSYLRRGVGQSSAGSPVGSPNRSREGSPVSRGHSPPPSRQRVSSSPGLTTVIEPDYSAMSHSSDAMMARGRDQHQQSSTRDVPMRARAPMNPRTRTPAWLRKPEDEGSTGAGPSTSPGVATTSRAGEKMPSTRSKEQETMPSSSSSSSSTTPSLFRPGQPTKGKADTIASTVQECLRPLMKRSLKLTSGQIGKINAAALRTVTSQLRDSAMDSPGFHEKLTQMAEAEVQRRVTAALEN